MRSQAPSPKYCPVCGVAMVASKSAAQGSADDTFTCFNCDFVMTLTAPPRAEDNSGERAE